MKKHRKFVPLLASAASLLIAAVLVVGAAAAPDPFKGKWHSIDVDGSYQTLVIGGGPGSTYHVRYHDYGASVCGVDGTGAPLYAASAVGSLSASGTVLAGRLPVYCLASPRYLFEDPDTYFEFEYVAGTLVDIHGGVVWTH
jgi:hypothetical protein